MIINIVYRFIVKIEDSYHLHIFPSRVFLKAAYYVVFGEDLDLKQPRAFTEKIQWIKLYDKNPLYTVITDKYMVRRYISEKIGKEYIVPLLEVWEKPRDIDFEKLPTKCVIKCTHDCGSVIVYDKNKNIDTQIKKYIQKKYRRNFYYVGREWAYKNIRRRIVVEPYLVDENGTLLDYKFFCFNGKVRFFKIDFDRHIQHRANYYDVNGKFLNFGEEAYPRDPNRNVRMPNELHKMIALAEKLADGFSFLRVDMYNCDDNIMVGELSLYPGSGLLRYDPDEWDYMIGELLQIPYEGTISKN